MIQYASSIDEQKSIDGNQDYDKNQVLSKNGKENLSIKKQLISNDFDFESIFKIDESIRFIGVCTTEGILLDASYREGISPLLSDSLLKISAVKTAIRHTFRIESEGDMGKPLYSVTTYENVKRATIPFTKELLLLISFEKKTNERFLIEKIFKLIFKTKL